MQKSIIFLFIFILLELQAQESNKIAFKTLSKYMDEKPNFPSGDLSGFKPYDNSWIQELTPADKARQKSSMGEK